MIDKIKNPWSRKEGVVVFDIETNWVDDWSEQGKRNRVFKCGVAFSYDENKFYKFTDSAKFVELLKKAKTLISYNGEGFDFLVLEKYGLKIKKFKNRWIPKSIGSCDIMHTIHERRPKQHKNKKYPKLDEIIFHHYGSKKTKYDAKNSKQVLKHCLEDVKYTKMLYEEKIWKVPVIDRLNSKRRWTNYYDDDASGAVWNGENWTNLADFGKPFVTIGKSDTLLCPMCKKNKLPLYEIARLRTDKLKCLKCKAIVTFMGPTKEILSVQTEDDFDLSICPNCGKRIEKSAYNHHGWGAGRGHHRFGRSICPVCSEGCYEWDDEDTPGFRDHWKGMCCKCKKDVDKWYHSKKRSTKRKPSFLN